MGAEFYVSRCYDVSGVGLVIAGWVESGELRDGHIGRTSKGVKFALVKIEKDGRQASTTKNKEKANLFVKHVTRNEIKPGETIYFE